MFLRLIIFLLFFICVPDVFAKGQLWTIHPSSPIFTGGAQSWEGSFDQEPQVFNFGGTNWVMFFNNVSFTPTRIYMGRLTSTDGINWTDSSPTQIMGGGVNNEAGTVAHAGFYYDGTTLYTFYADANGTGNIWRQQSTNQGLTWTNRTEVLTVSGAPATVLGFATSSVVLNGSTYVMYIEVQTSATETWRILRYTASSITGTWTYDSVNSPITTLRVHTNSGYNGPNLHIINGIWYDWYHSNRTATPGQYPTECSFASSLDGLNTWTQLSQSLQPLANQINTASPLNVGTPPQQTADCRAVEVDGKSYLYYTRATFPKANIGVATFNGTLAQLIDLQTTNSISQNAQIKNGKVE